MTTARPDLDTISLGSCPTCGGPAQAIPRFSDAQIKASAASSIAVTPAVDYREVRLPNIDEDLGGTPPRQWHLTGIDPVLGPIAPDRRWRASARDRDRMGDVEYGFGDTPSAAYLALKTALGKRA